MRQCLPPSECGASEPNRGDGAYYHLPQPAAHECTIKAPLPENLSGGTDTNLGSQSDYF